MGNLLTNKIICCSKYIEDSIIKNFKIKNSKSTLIYNCYDQQKFKFISNLKIKSKIRNQKNKYWNGWKIRSSQRSKITYKGN